jgi:hypothetical protein
MQQTNKTFDEAGKSMEQSADEARGNALDLEKSARRETREDREGSLEI